MYEELIKRLREEASSWCINCCYRTGECICTAPDDSKRDCDIYSKLEAADAIEELNRRIGRAVELYNRNVEKSAMYEALAGISPKPKEDE